MKQLNLIPKPKLAYGGSLKNTRGTRRILSTKRPIHLVLKANKSILVINKHFLQKTLHKQAKKQNIKFYAKNINLNHIHLVLKISSIDDYKKFIRAFCGLVARKLGRGIWKFCPYTRIASWGREYRKLMDYVELNNWEVFYGVKLKKRE